MDEVRKTQAMMPATIKSGHALALPHTPGAAIITATLPMASFLEHSHTKRTFASKSTLGIDRPGTRRRLQHCSALRWPEFAEHRLRHGPVTAPKSWSLMKNGKRKTVHPVGPLVADNSEAVLTAAIEGLGIVYAADWLAGPALRVGKLVEILPG